MKIKNEIIKGDFPEGSNIDFTNYFSKEDIGISWMKMVLFLFVI